MGPIRCLVMMLAALAACGACAQTQTLYRTVGPDGKVTYTDRPGADSRVEKSLRIESGPSSPVPPPSSAYLEWLKSRPAPAAAAVSGEVVLYAADWCGYCRQARAYLAAKGIAYRNVDIDTEAGRYAFAASGGGKGGIPFIVRGKAQLRGFTAASYDVFFAR